MWGITKQACRAVGVVCCAAVAELPWQLKGSEMRDISVWSGRGHFLILVANSALFCYILARF
jgi:hypothetical protein